MPDTRPLKVFLCHASADKVAVRKLYQYLHDRKMDPWLDVEKLLPGQNWQVEIPKALYASDVIIICLSKSSVDKEGYVQKEIKFALDKALEMPDGRIFLIPARLEECELPHSLSAYHYVDLFEADGYRRLLRSLRIRAQQIGATKVLVGEDVVSLDAARIAQEKVAQEKVEREAAEVAEHEKAERDVAEKLALEVTERENGEKVMREKAERDAVAKAAREKTEREAREKLVREKTESDVKEKAHGEIKTEITFEKPVATKLPKWSIGFIAVAIFALIAWGISSMQASPKMNNQMPSATQTFFVENRTEAHKSVTSTATTEPLSSEAPTLDSTLGIGSTMIGKDGMTLLYVPAGEFKMGSLDEDASANADEKPQHTVYLDAFWIDQTEVTNKQYAACVFASQCKPPSNTSSFSHASYYGNSQFDNYPVIYVDWNQATAYCLWAGRRLPSEAEWEKAARGTDARIYPWGNDAPTKNLLNFNNNVGDTTKVGSYLLGKSFYGAYDMVGNVWEWVYDGYQSDYYATLGNFASDPKNPSGYTRVTRGGSWRINEVLTARTAVRAWVYPTSRNVSNYNDLGFRCASDVTP